MNKNIYFYWGNNTMSYMRYMTLHSFCKLNPDWVVHLIQNSQQDERLLSGTVEKQDKTEFKGADYSHFIDNLDINTIDFENKMINLDEEVVRHMSDVHIKDILNWKILSECGGVVADMDILFTAPMGNLISDDTDVGLICFDKYPQPDYIPVSFMYSSGHNSFFQKTYENALIAYDKEIYESCGTLCIEEKNLDEIRKSYPNIEIQKLPDASVFPFVNYEWNRGIEMLYRGDNSKLLHPESVGIHWYAGTPQSQQYNNYLNCNTIHNSSTNNTISTMIRRIL